MSGIKQVYPSLQVTAPEEIHEPCADRSYHINACPLEYEVRPQKTCSRLSFEENYVRSTNSYCCEIQTSSLCEREYGLQEHLPEALYLYILSLPETVFSHHNYSITCVIQSPAPSLSTASIMYLSVQM